MKDNRGFSIVEIVIVIAIIAVLSSMGFALFGVADNGRIRENVKSITSALERASYNTQAKAAKYWMVELRTTADGKYYVDMCKVLEDDTIEKVEETELENKKTSIAISTTLNGVAALEDVAVTDGESISIYFEKQTGEVIKMIAGGVVYEQSELKGNAGNISVKCGEQERNIEIYWSTGKVFDDGVKG